MNEPQIKQIHAPLPQFPEHIREEFNRLQAAIKPHLVNQDATVVTWVMLDYIYFITTQVVDKKYRPQFAKAVRVIGNAIESAE